MKIAFIVELTLPAGAEIDDLQRYILTEIKAGVGGLRPDDPLFHLDRESVQVRQTATATPPLRKKR